MKKIIILMFVISLQIIAQNPNWISLKPTNIDVSNAISFDMFSNGYGHHVIVQESNALKYYKMNTNGNAGSAITLESTSVISPSICGDNNRLYVVYRKSSENYIRTKFSNDGGTTWSYLSSNPQNSNANSMESVFSNNKLHITFDVSNTIYYAFYNTQTPPSWSALQTVSAGENGNLPRITSWYTSSQDRVIFLYSKTATESRWREWNASTNAWVNNPQTAFTVSANSGITPKGISVDANYFYSFYEVITYNPYAVYSQYQQRSRANNSVITTSIPRPEMMVPDLYTTTTANNISHTAFYYNGVLESGYEIGIMRYKHTGSGIDADPAYPFNFNFDYPTMINTSSTSNDVFVLWKDGLSNYLQLVYDDQVPLEPQNLGAVATSDYHPKLLWTNTNADAKKYYIYRSTYNGGYTTPIAAVDHNSSLSSQFFIDYTISVPRLGGQAGAKYYYVVKTEDWGQNMSGFSNSVEVTSSNLYWEKRLSDNIESVSKYVLDQNYPNPFNPSTKISYSIKEEGLVTLKVYDVLGKEAAVLVNENKPVGNYEVDFDASQLPSGVYIYKLQAGGFSDVKKMLLTK